MIHYILYYRHHNKKSERYVIERKNLTVRYGVVGTDFTVKTFEKEEDIGIFTAALTKKMFDFYDMIRSEEYDDNGALTDKWVRSKESLDEYEVAKKAAKLFAAAMEDSKKISSYVSFCNKINLDYYEDRYGLANGSAGHVQSLLKKWGFNKANDDVMGLIAAQLLYDDNQFAEDELTVLAKIGLKEAALDEEFTDKLLVYVKKRAQYLIDNVCTNTDSLQRDITRFANYLGIDLAAHKAFSKFLKSLSTPA